MKPASGIDGMAVQAAAVASASDATWAAGSYWAGCGWQEIVSGYILKAQFEGVLVRTVVGTV